MATPRASIVPRALPPRLRDAALCGICDRVHDCHCPVLQSWCDHCRPEDLTEREMIERMQVWRQRR